VTVDVVIPTSGRPSLRALLEALAAAGAPPGSAGRVLVVDDRPGDVEPLSVDPVPAALAGRVQVLRGPARGPAAARNVGWRAARGEWVAFVDDDVLPRVDWADRLCEDLRAAGDDVAAVQGAIHVPLPLHRRPTDWERNVAGLAEARWATADMAYRRDVLEQLGGFDERFRRAYREDADLALRVRAAGWRLERGTRSITHPVGPAGWWRSVALQVGNADDVLMRALHGPRWRERSGSFPGRRPWHVATTAAAIGALVAAGAGARRPGAALGATWLALTADFALRRIAPGPRDGPEVARMVSTSVLIPPVATAWWVRGLARWGGLLARQARRRPAAVLLDRDGTLIRDVPYNGDPAKVVPMPGAREALERLREAGVRLAVVSNQSGVARGLITMDEVRAVNARVEELLGPIGPWIVCEHGPDDGCACRKPAPGMVLEAARRLAVAPERCAVIGDIGADVEAARAAGARAVLVPTPVTRPEEVAAAPAVARTIEGAVELLLEGGA
jgi:histidinol-phosphate phosphatase family protein